MLFGTIDLIKNIKIITHHISLSQSARKFRIGSQCCGCMSRHFNFGNDRNETVGCIFHNFLYFFLRIIAPLFFSIVAPWEIVIRMSYLGLFTIRAYFGQFRIFLYFYPPPLVIRQMKMEFIQFIKCHQIKKLQHFLFWQKITSYIHHSPTMRETGGIRNADSRNPNLFLAFPVTIINGCRHELQQRLDTIKKSCGSFIGRYIYPIGRNLQCIGLIGQGIVYRQTDISLFCFRNTLQRHSSASQRILQIMKNFHRGFPGRDSHCFFPLQDIYSLHWSKFIRHGYNTIVCRYIISHSPTREKNE